MSRGGAVTRSVSRGDEELFSDRRRGQTWSTEQTDHQGVEEEEERTVYVGQTLRQRRHHQGVEEEEEKTDD